jgi:hypothetical protein
VENNDLSHALFGCQQPIIDQIFVVKINCSSDMAAVKLIPEAAVHHSGLQALAVELVVQQGRQGFRGDSRNHICGTIKG